MNYVDFDPTQLTGKQREWWDEWSQRAKNATTRTLKSAKTDEKVKFEQRVWSELKAWLLEYVFDGKCAYCESKVTDTEWGDADHYRPKGRVAVRHGQEQIIVSRDGIQHPGYYWIAYNWRNLLPSCKRCNTERKRDWFPVSNCHVFNPDECSDCAEMDIIEQPLLLTPYRSGEFHPRKHLAFGKRGGVWAKNGSRMGRVSIEVYHLRRKDLNESRRRAQQNAWLRYLQLLGNNQKAKLREFLARVVEGHEEYAAAVADYLSLKIDEQESCKQALSQD